MDTYLLYLLCVSQDLHFAFVSLSLNLVEWDCSEADPDISIRGEGGLEKICFKKNQKLLDA